jgi:uncharacterized protein YaaQ
MGDMEPRPKLVISVVHQEDAESVAEALRTAGHRFTRLPSFGGFLNQPNQTFLVAVDTETLDPLIALIASSTQTREVEVPLVLHERLAEWQASTVRHGGATSLVVDLERIVRS